MTGRVPWFAAPGVELIAAERERQVSAEGWTPEHDDTHVGEELAKAAACYAMPDEAFTGTLDRTRASIVPAWPWESEWDKRDPNVRCWVPSVRQSVYQQRDVVAKCRIRELVKAGALIAAEIDRLSRAAGSQKKPVCGYQGFGSGDHPTGPGCTRPKGHDGPCRESNSQATAEEPS